MPIWSETTSTYKVGTFGVLFSVCLFIIGFGSPFWFKSLDQVTGLWQQCTSSLEHCSTIQFGATGYFDALRVFQILAIIALLIGVIMIGVVNMLDTKKSAGLVVTFVVIGGILGCFGDGMFGISGVFLQAVLGTAYATLFWSFALNTIGSILAIIFGIVIAVSMKSHGIRGHVVNPLQGQMQVYHSSVQQTTAIGVHTGQQQPAYGQMPGQQQPAYGQMPGQQQPAYGQMPGQQQPAYGQMPGQQQPAYGQMPAPHPGQIQQPPSYWQSQPSHPGQQTSTVVESTPPPANYKPPPSDESQNT